MISPGQGPARATGVSAHCCHNNGTWQITSKIQVACNHEYFIFFLVGLQLVSIQLVSATLGQPALGWHQAPGLYLLYTCHSGTQLGQSLSRACASPSDSKCRKVNPTEKTNAKPLLASYLLNPIGHSQSHGHSQSQGGKAGTSPTTWQGHDDITLLQGCEEAGSTTQSTTWLTWWKSSRAVVLKLDISESPSRPVSTQMQVPSSRSF